MPDAPPLPPGQQLAAPGKWPLVGERSPAQHDGDWTVTVSGCVATPRVYDLAALRRLRWHRRPVDIHCVTRWSKLAVDFAGVELADLLAAAEPTSLARFVSFVARSDRGHSTSLVLSDALDLGAFVALEVENRPLPVEHGGPVRLVVPGRYFYKSLKWLQRIELLAADRLGYWEGEAGYHNVADPWREERYIAADVSRHEMRRLLAARSFAGLNLLSLQARGHDLTGLDARGAVLRNADFRECVLARASFDGANLANAHFAGAELRGATFAAADLEGADFSAADLNGADLRGASLFGATFTVAGEPRAARLDIGTRIDEASLAQLAPPQADFVRRARHTC
ncbi:MAG TPA: molybdopterin-dependent oxidoreductase [Pirellulales bacterium]|nr:molybdopterin-dependent oxidoreductase [Pirellulales bacterium]